jgi:hypothetical protein
MDFDLRFPIGWLFTVYGLLVGGFGFFGSQQIYTKSLGFNINLFWGGVMFVFGVIMLFYASTAKPAPAELTPAAIEPEGADKELVSAGSTK